MAKTKLTETVEAPEAEATPEATPAPEAVSAPVAETVPAPEEEESEGIPAAELSRYVEKFGAAKGVEYLQAGTSFEDALSEEFDSLKQKQELGSAGDRGEATAVGEFAGGDSDDVGGDVRMPKAVRGMASVINGRGFPSTN